MAIIHQNTLIENGITVRALLVNDDKNRIIMKAWIGVEGKPYMSAVPECGTTAPLLTLDKLGHRVALKQLSTIYHFYTAAQAELQSTQHVFDLLTRAFPPVDELLKMAQGVEAV